MNGRQPEWCRTYAAVAAVAVCIGTATASAAAPSGSSWHSGYRGPNSHGVYGRWRSDLRCRPYATYGCVHFEAITARGCRYMQITVAERRGGAIVGTMIDNEVNVPPKTRVIFELDADQSGVQSGEPVVVSCY